MADDVTDTSNAPPVSDLTPGTTLSNTYEIVEYIALGGMAEVYKARNIHTDEPVAIKVVLPEFARDEMRLSLFRKEATVLSRLHHDAIVHYHMFTVEKETNRPYLVMEFVKGTPLSDRMKDGPLGASDTKAIIKRVAEGLSVAHELGVVHRDLSPDNVVLPDGNVGKAKIIDFGIAKDTGGGTLLGGKFAGKYNFVSPEQLGLFGGEITGQSDIYSLGLIAIAALRGEALDMSGTHAEVIDKRRVVPDLSDIDADLRPAIAAMLSPDPAKRPATMQAVIEILSAPPPSAKADDPWGDPTPAKTPAPDWPASNATVIAPRPPQRAPGGQPPRPPVRGAGATVVTGAPVSGQAARPQQDSESPFGAYVPPPGSTPILQAPAVPPRPPLQSNLAPPAAERKRRGGSGGLIALAVVVVAILGAGGIGFTQNWFGLLGPKPVPVTPAGEDVAVNNPDPTPEPDTPTIPDPTPPEGQSTLVPDDQGGEDTPPDTTGPVTPPGGVTQPDTGEPDVIETDPPPDVDVAVLDPDKPVIEIPPLEGVPAMLAWVNSYRLSSCEFAQALTADERSMSIEAFGTEVPPFETMMLQFEAENRIEPDIGMRMVAEPQCPAVDFLRFVKPLAEAGPQLSVDSTVVNRATQLTGNLQAISGWSTDVLLVDDDGLVHSVPLVLSQSGSTASFRVGVQSDTSAAAPLLVLSISSRGGLQSPAAADGLPASAVFPAILKEMQTTSTNIAIGVKYVKLAAS